MDGRGALLGVGGYCVDTRGLAVAVAAAAADRFATGYTSKPELVHLSLSALEGRGSDSPVALRPAGPADFREQCGAGTDYRLPSDACAGAVGCGSQCPCVLQLNVGSSPLPLATTVARDQVGTRARGPRGSVSNDVALVLV